MYKFQSVTVFAVSTFINVTVPEQNSLTAAQCLSNMRASNKDNEQLKLALMGEHCLALG